MKIVTNKSEKSGKKILIAEDERAYARALSLKLEREGFDVTVSENGETALEFLRRYNFDLFILDLIMPKMGGFEVLDAIKKENIDVKIIVVSNLTQEEDRTKAVNLGAKAFVEKADSSIIDIVNNIKSLVL